MMDFIKNKIISVVEENGIQIMDDGTLGDLDSLKYVSMLVSLEQEFEVEFPDEFLMSDNVIDIEILTLTINNILSKVQA